LTRPASHTPNRCTARPNSSALSQLVWGDAGSDAAAVRHLKCAPEPRIQATPRAQY
jgi:hypothetical protein